MIAAVYFDIDGTLLDHDRASLLALPCGVERARPALDPGARADAEAEWRRLEELHYGEYLLGTISLGEQRRRRVAGLLQHLGATPRDSIALDSWFACFLEDYRRSWSLFDDAEPVLRALLRQRRMGVITNADATLQQAKLAGVGIAPLLPAVVASSEAGVAKPDPEIFRLACRRAQLAPAEVAYVGDRLETDARGAAAAGLLGIWLNRDPAVESVDDVPTIRSLSELPGLL
jgi:putative hydrolase of the HAD superfamily